MSQPGDVETFIYRQKRNYYFDENNNIWCHKDGNVVTTLYLASLPHKLTRDEISHDLSCFGEVEDVRITKHSYGFVTFKQPESATKALSAEFHTIGGHKTRVAIAKSELSKKLLKHKIIKGNANALLSLNDDCLREIFSLVDEKDLCSLAVTCSRLKNIAEQIFSKNGKLPMERWNDSKLILVTFGSLISKLEIDFQFSNKKNIRLLNLATRYCSDTLETLMLNDIVIPARLTVKLKPLLKKIKTLHLEYCTIEGADKEFFAGCDSLIELKVNKMNSGEEALIVENTYPKLQRFIFYPESDLNLQVFMKRHTNLKSLSLWCHSAIWPTFGDDCKQLDEFDIGCECGGVKYIESFKRLSTLNNLRKLNINLDEQSAQSVTTIMKELKSFKSLQCLELQDAEADAGFIPALLQQKQLQVFRLINCNGLLNLSGLGGLRHLKELTLILNKNFEIELVSMIESLINLQILHFKCGNFKLNSQMYLKIVDVVRGRPFKLQQFLELTCFIADDFKCDANSFKILKLKKLLQ